MAKLLSYKAKWNLNDHSGQVVVKLIADGSINPNATFTHTLQPQTPDEMHMLLDLLRNEKPIEYDTLTKEVRLGEWEVVGEGE